jgi:hypothetical protein
MYVHIKIRIYDLILDKGQLAKSLEDPIESQRIPLTIVELFKIWGAGFLKGYCGDNNNFDKDPSILPLYPPPVCMYNYDNDHSYSNDDDKLKVRFLFKNTISPVPSEGTGVKGEKGVGGGATVELAYDELVHHIGKVEGYVYLYTYECIYMYSYRHMYIHIYIYI